MSNYISIQGQKVKVTKEVYKEYYKMGRRRRYLEEDLKVGSSKIDPETGRVIYMPSKEDSIERLMDKGGVFSGGQAVDDLICDKAMMVVLQEALKELDEEEAKVIDHLYFQNLTTRKSGEKIGKSHVTVGKKHKKALDKLKISLVKAGYQDSSFIG